MMSNKEILLITMDGIATVTMGIITAVMAKKLSEEKTKNAEERLKNEQKENELKILRTNLQKMEQFLEWEVDYMENKMNLNMIELSGEYFGRFGEKELKDIKEKTKKYTNEEILKSLRKRIEIIRDIISENNDSGDNEEEASA